MQRVHANEALRLTATEPNEVWSWDFVFDQTEWGGSYRILSVIDEYTRPVSKYETTSQLSSPKRHRGS